MSPKKLTEDDKQEILQLYRQTPETTSTLAERYGVSSSTISRFLKSYLSETEYEELIQQKRLARTSKSETPASEEKVEKLKKVEQIKQVEQVEQIKPVEQVEQLSFTPSLFASLPAKEKPILISKEIATPKIHHEEILFEEEDDEDEIEAVNVMAIGEMLGEDLADLDDDEDDLEDDEDEDWDEEEEPAYVQTLTNKDNLKVLPFSAASFPKTCYLVIDRASELITRPLKEFAHLGIIPLEEVSQKTLPIFDNHRVARRFSNRSQRVIKVPDGRILKKTGTYLQAKGITRILLDGNIYSLSLF